MAPVLSQNERNEAETLSGGMKWHPFRGEMKQHPFRGGRRGKIHSLASSFFHGALTD
jgi:hypothetical protein